MIVVEGRTEEEFVKQLLITHLREHGVQAAAKVLGPRGRRGGNVTVDRIAADVKLLSSNFQAITTLVDLYGFRSRPTDDVQDLQRLIDRACRDATSRELRDDRVFSYVQRYEFEALLFSDVRAFERSRITSASMAGELGSVRQRFGNPEDINDSPETAPSKRIGQAIPGYNKVEHGILVATEIGIAAMREQCPRFAQWLTRLESLGSGADES